MNTTSLGEPGARIEMQPEARSHLLFFARWPEPGRVKTRIAAQVGAEEACRVHQLLAEACFASARGVPNARLIVCGTGANPESFRRWLGGADAYWEQPEGELGDRLESMFRSAFDEGAERVVAIGSDSPGLKKEDIRSSFFSLDSSDVVLLPAEDGGYVLIGTKSHYPLLFQQMPWSTSGLLCATLAACAERGLKVKKGSFHRDVDTAEEWALVPVEIRTATPRTLTKSE